MGGLCGCGARQPSYARLAELRRAYFAKFKVGCALGFERDGLPYDLSDEAIDPSRVEMSRDAKSEAAELARGEVWAGVDSNH
jgi:hypothetical protein